MKNTRFIRYNLQGRTPVPVSVTTMGAAVQNAYDAMISGNWVRSSQLQAVLPAHNWAQTGHSPNYDAYTFCGDYASGKQHAYAGAVCYTFRIPADALAGTVAKISKIEIPAFGDRWLKDGATITAHVSASETPPTWVDVLAVGTGSTKLAAQMAVTPSNSGTDSSTTLTFDWTSAPVTSLAYVHIVLRMTSYLTYRGAWIEGGAMFDGANIEWTFDRAVTADVVEGFDDWLPIYPLHFPPSAMSRQSKFNYATAYPSTADSATLHGWREVLNNSHVLMQATADYNTIAYGAFAITTDSLSRTVGMQTAFCFFSTGRSFDALFIEDQFSAYITSGVNIRVTVYGISTGAFGLTPAEWLSKVHPDTASPGAFWQGASTNIKVLYDDASEATLACVRLASVVIPGGGLIGHGEAIRFDAPWTPSGDSAIVIAFSVDDLTTPQPTTTDTPYGWISSALEVAYLRQT